MESLMQDFPLTIQHIFWRAEKLFGEKQIVSKLPDGVHRYSYAEFAERTRRLAGALVNAGVKPGDRVATFAWNHFRHHELYFAVPNIGVVLHTLNIRLFEDQLTYIVNHADDKMIFFDDSLADALQGVIDSCEGVERYIQMGSDETGIDATGYEEFLDSSDPIRSWPELDEKSAAGMCYTSGTTGNPKGVVYSHRSTVLHAMGTSMGACFGLSEADTTLSIVPMFHAMAWGTPYSATLSGANQVYPGHFLDPASLCELITQEQVTFSAGVPTIWLGVAEELKKGDHDTSSIRLLSGGGAPVPRSLIETFRNELGIDFLQGWGMTETSPVCAQGQLKSGLADLGEEAQMDYFAKTGYMIPGVEFRIVDEDDEELPWDGKAFGELQVKGPWIASGYYDDPRSEDSFVDGWLRTGDVATVDELGYFQIVDRTKDLVKSGGEWISSVELEKEIMGHPSVLEAAVIGLPHSKWTERPVACVVLRDGESLTREGVVEHLRDRVAKWWLPDDVIFIDEVPKTSVGKFDKKALRARFEDHRLPTDS